MDKRESIISILEEKGFKPSVDNDGDVHIRYQMKHIFFLIGDNEEPYVIAMFPQFLSVTEGDEGLVLAACNKITRIARVGKVYITENYRDVTATYEFWYTDEESLKMNIDRSLGFMSITRSALTNIIREMRDTKE